MTSLKTSIKTITYLSDIGCLEIQGASLAMIRHITKAELSRVEIVELLSQESEKFHNIGLSRGEVL